MTIRWSLLSLNRRLALLVIVLGAVAVFAGNPYGGTSTRVSAKELAVIVGTEVDHVSPEELANWIIQGRVDFRLVDLRNEAAFAEYHIPQAELVPMEGLLDHGLQRNEKIVLYSDGGIHSAQAWFLLKAKGYNGVYILRGGLEEWKDAVLFPRLAPNATPQQAAQFERKAQIAKFFGGSAQTGAATEATAPKGAMPKLAAPAAPGPAPAASGAKKKKEGC
jgi:rhodanese-related sulfurtransferase